MLDRLKERREKRRAARLKKLDERREGSSERRAATIEAESRQYENYGSGNVGAMGGAGMIGGGGGS